MFPSYRNELVDSANQLTSFYMIGTLVVKELNRTFCLSLDFIKELSAFTELRSSDYQNHFDINFYDHHRA